MEAYYDRKIQAGTEFRCQWSIDEGREVYSIACTKCDTTFSIHLTFITPSIQSHYFEVYQNEK
jgi:hypothetical protein